MEQAIVDRSIEEGVEIDQVIALGGIPQKNDLVMQITSDVLRMPINVAAAEQACALGAAMFGAVAAGAFASVEEAQREMGSGFSRTFKPMDRNAGVYDKLYKEYLSMGEALEGQLSRL